MEGITLLGADSLFTNPIKNIIFSEAGEVKLLVDMDLS